MIDKVLLRFNYHSNVIDINIDDKDKVNLLDLIVEWVDGNVKLAKPMPRHPCFSYVHKMRHFSLNCDKDLMIMCNVLQKTEVIIWVGSLEVGSELMSYVHSLRNLQGKPIVHMGHLSPEPFSPKQVSIVANTPQSPAPQSHPPNMSVRKSPRFVSNVHCERQIPDNPTLEYDEDQHDIVIMHVLEDKWVDMDISPINTQVTKAKGKGNAKLPITRAPKSKKKLGYAPLGCETNEVVVHPDHFDLGGRGSFEMADVRQPTNTTKTNSSKSSKASAIILKKVPKSTAIRKGIYESGSKSHNSKDSGVESIARNRRNIELQVNNVDDFDNSNGSKDVEYQPTDGSDGLEYDISVGYDEWEDVDDEVINMVDDYDPWNDTSPDNYDDVNYLNRIYMNGEMYIDKGWGNIILKPWQLFMDKKQLRDVVRDYAIQSQFEYIVERANNSIYTIVCSGLDCGWRLHASVLPDGFTWAIKTLHNEHTCRGLDSYNSLVTVNWAANKLMEDINANNDIYAKTLNELLDSRYGVQMKLSTLYKMRSTALNLLNGGHDDSYGFLPKYSRMIMETNPGSVAICAWTPRDAPERPLTFSSIFISFKAAIDGLISGCRSFIGVDGTHLKGNYGGVLLSAIALDANNQLFPFAWAIVSGENEDTWKFFIWHIKNLLKDSGRGDEWTIISDRQKGCDIAITKLWPKAGRRFCCKHLSKNWKNKFPGGLMYALFWRASNATSKFTFRKAMEQIQEANPQARVWLADIGEQSRWSKHAFNPVICCDENKSNFVESFNATLGIDRCRPVLTLLEAIRRVTMVRMATRREGSEDWEDNQICPIIVKRVQKLIVDARTCKAFNSGGGFYEVRDGKSTLPVSLNDKTCACNAWQITGIPCKHGIKAILHSSQDPLSFCSDWYSCGKYKKAYGSSIKAIPDTDQWPEIEEPIIGPPELKRGVGRPPRNRKRDAEEERKGKRSKTVKCSKCKNFGHNAKTCMGGLTKKAQNEASTSTSAPKKNLRRPEVRLSQPLSRMQRRVTTRSLSASQPNPTTKSTTSKKRKKNE